LPILIFSSELGYMLLKLILVQVFTKHTIKAFMQSNTVVINVPRCIDTAMQMLVSFVSI